MSILSLLLVAFGFSSPSFAQSLDGIAPDFGTPMELLTFSPFADVPPDMTPAQMAASLKSMANADLKFDKACGTSAATIAKTEHHPTGADLNTCAGYDNEMVFRRSTRALYLCERGVIARAVKVSIGSAGMGKTRDGDKKTPTGSYWLGLPRSSDDFGIFIPIGYPNAEDIQQGHTGSDLGIHSMKRWSVCMPDAALGIDWTTGCVAVTRDQQISDIGHWVLSHWPVQLHTFNN